MTLRLDFLALLQNFGRVIDLSGPTQIGHVDHAINAVLHLDEGAICREVTHFALDRAANRVSPIDVIPWVGVELPYAE